MERSVSTLRFGVEGPVVSAREASTCGACGEEFEEPLLAMAFSESVVEEYYACPKCLSKVASVGRGKAAKVAEVEAEDEAVEEPVAIKDSTGEVAGCLHHLGYLKRRGKNVPIPEECLTCSKMIDCMY